MPFANSIREFIREDRFAVNLIAAHAVVLVILAISYALRRLLHRGAWQLPANNNTESWVNALGEDFFERARALLFWGTLAAIMFVVMACVGYHLVGRDVRADINDWWRAWVEQDHQRLVVGALGIVAALLGSWITVRLVRIGFPILRKLAGKFMPGQANEAKLDRWFGMLERCAIVAALLGSVWVVGELIGMPGFARHIIIFLLRAATVIILARLLVVAAPLVAQIATLVGNRQLGQGRFKNYWEKLISLFPLAERCFEIAVYVLGTYVCLDTLHFTRSLAAFGPPIAGCVGIFLATRVLIELLEVGLYEGFGMYKEGGQVDAKGRTLVPLVHSLCQYVLYFGSGVIMLGVIGVDTTPVLAGAGIIGLGVGLGAQSLVTDVVSGFFILFEGQYLVGDYVQVGDASGNIEAVGIRVTQIRDVHGKLHIIPNGQIKGVVNYSKGYINAVVDIKVPRGTELQSVFRAMSEAGKRLRQQNKEVLADTEIHGIVDLAPDQMTVRAVTRVRPGTHGKMQSEYRRLLKEVFDRDLTRELPAKAA